MQKAEKSSRWMKMENVFTTRKPCWISSAIIQSGWTGEKYRRTRRAEQRRRRRRGSRQRGWRGGRRRRQSRWRRHNQQTVLSTDGTRVSFSIDFFFPFSFLQSSIIDIEIQRWALSYKYAIKLRSMKRNGSVRLFKKILTIIYCNYSQLLSGLWFFFFANLTERSAVDCRSAAQPQSVLQIGDSIRQILELPTLELELLHFAAHVVYLLLHQLLKQKWQKDFHAPALPDAPVIGDSIPRANVRES